MHQISIVLSLVLAVMAGPAAIFAAPPRPGEPVLVLFSPFRDVDALLARAGASRIGPLHAPLAVLAAGPGMDLADRLLASGALAVSDGSTLAQLCGV